MWEINASKLLHSGSTVEKPSLQGVYPLLRGFLCTLELIIMQLFVIFLQTKFEEQVKVQATLENIGKQVEWK